MSVGENFIPWSMIEPLLEDGMTGRQLGDAILKRMGLTRERYSVVSYGTGPVRDCIKGGAYIVKRDVAALFRNGHDEPTR